MSKCERFLNNPRELFAGIGDQLRKNGRLFDGYALRVNTGHNKGLVLSMHQSKSAASDAASRLNSVSEEPDGYSADETETMEDEYYVNTERKIIRHAKTTETDRNGIPGDGLYKK